jgi:hypothetical protein
MFTRLMHYIGSMFRDENGKPSSSKYMLIANWFVVIGTYLYHVLSTGLIDVTLALGLLGIGTANRGISQFNNFRSQSNQPTRSLFSNTDNGQPRS